MREQILSKLAEFEKKYGFEVILAVESGSRGWGFASKNSDYDIRFVYKYPIKKYLGIQKPKDTINVISGELDFEGYDIHKFYDLLAKSNMNIIDWVMQDTIYVDKLKKKDELISVINKLFDARTYCAHNYGLAKSNYFKYFSSTSPSEPTAKRYLYCIKALLSAEYCLKFGKIAPLKFSQLVSATCDTDMKRSVLHLVDIKKSIDGKKQYKNMELEEYIKSRLNAYELPDTQGDTARKLYLSYLNDNLLLQLGLSGDTDIPALRKQVVAFIEKEWGKQVGESEPGCPCCKAWDCYNYIFQVGDDE